MGLSISLAQQRPDTMRRTRHNHSPQAKAKVGTTALRGDKILTELADQFRRAPQPDHPEAPAVDAEHGRGVRLRCQ